MTTFLSCKIPHKNIKHSLISVWATFMIVSSERNINITAHLWWLLSCYWEQGRESSCNDNPTLSGITFTRDYNWFITCCSPYISSMTVHMRQVEFIYTWPHIMVWIMNVRQNNNTMANNQNRFPAKPSYLKKGITLLQYWIHNLSSHKANNDMRLEQTCSYRCHQTKNK